MNNGEFISTLIVCNDLKHIDGSALNRLKTSKLNMQELYSELKKGFDTNSSDINENALLLNVLNGVDVAYNLREDRDKFIEDFRKSMRLQSEIRVIKDYTNIKKGIYGCSFRQLVLSKDSRSLKMVRLFPSAKLCINGEVHRYTALGRAKWNQILIDSKESGLGGIFIKGNKLEEHIVKDRTSFSSLVDKVLDDDYDLVIVPSFSYLGDTVDVEELYNIEELDNKNYLEYILLCGDIIEEEINVQEYWKISNSDIKYNRIMYYLRGKGIKDGVILSFLCVIDDMIRKEENKGENRDDIVNELERTIKRLRVRHNHLVAFKKKVMQDNKRSEELSLDYCMEILEELFE